MWDFNKDTITDEIKNIPFGKFISDNGFIEPNKKAYKLKIEPFDLKLYYNINEEINFNKFYFWDNISYNSGKYEGIF